MDLERRYLKKLNESLESDFATEVSKREFSEICKSIGNVLNVLTIDAEPENFEALRDALTELVAASRACAENNQELLTKSVEKARYELDRDRS